MSAPFPIRPTFLLVAALVVGLAAGSGSISLAASDDLGQDGDRRPAVLLELFTSQGCSSCPPADRLLSRVGAAGELAGVRVIPLAFHVDYWDRIGWKDPFSAREWSDRQRGYGQAFDLYNIYTPQVVVGGLDHAVGSDEKRLSELVAVAASRRSNGSIALQLADRNERSLKVAVAAQAPDHAAARVVVALFENGLVTEVRSGENARRALHEDYVVRRLVELPSGVAEAELLLEPGWVVENLGVAAFLQDTESRAVLAVESLDLAALADLGG
jgi:hypothetical protein